jgi:hypothetical protein
MGHNVNTALWNEIASQERPNGKFVSVPREATMRGKLRSLCFGLFLLSSTGLAFSIGSSAAAAPIAASKALRADDGQAVQVRVARGGHHGGAAYRGGSVRRGAAVYRGRAVVRRGAVVGGTSYGGSGCDPNYEDCGGGYYGGGAVVRGRAVVRGGTAVRGRGAHVAHRGGARAGRRR